MLYEQRVYTCYPGRMSNLLKRFETITLPIWGRYGIRQAGFWIPVVGKSNLELVYLLAWLSMTEREEKWEAFREDPEWLKKSSLPFNKFKKSTTYELNYDFKKIWINGKFRIFSINVSYRDFKFTQRK